MNEYLNDANIIYNKYKTKCENNLNFDIIMFIINNYPQNICASFLSYFSNKIDLNLIDKINGRSIIHYLLMYSIDNNFKILSNFLIKLKNFKLNNKINFNAKDRFERNALFYLFINHEEKITNKGPSFKLRYFINNKIFTCSLNDKDIFGNSLMFYAIKGRFLESIKVLFVNNYQLNNTENIEGNTIYSN